MPYMGISEELNIDAASLRKYLAIGIVVFVLIVLSFSSSFIVGPGHRGVLVTMGRVSSTFAPEGFGLKAPFITTVVPMSVRQQTGSIKTECFSSDLQQVNIDLRVLYRIPESAVVRIYQDYSGDPFDSLVQPRVNEAIKEVTALQSAESIVKKREDIKTKAFALIKQKVGNVLVIEDVVVQNISLSKELESAIEAKMVQEQEAAKAKFVQQKAEIEAKTVVIRAKGEAQSIQIRGEALKKSPALIQLQIVEKWNGVSPLVVGGGAGGGGSNIILPLGKFHAEQ